MTEIDDYTAIRNILADYCFFIDSGDSEGIGSLFTEDAQISGLYGEQSGRTEISGRIRDVGDRLVHGRHIITNTHLRVDGQNATGRSYVIALDISADAPPSIRTTSAYLDVFRKENGRWLIARRNIVATPAEALAHEDAR